MKDDIRPRGTVEVVCDVPGCRWSFWVGALDPRLPGGPFDCGADHERQARMDAMCERLRADGWEWQRHIEVEGVGAISATKADRYALCTWSTPEEFARLPQSFSEAQPSTWESADSHWREFVATLPPCPLGVKEE